MVRVFCALLVFLSVGSSSCLAQESSVLHSLVVDGLSSAEATSILNAEYTEQGVQGVTRVSGKPLPIGIWTGSILDVSSDLDFTLWFLKPGASEGEIGVSFDFHPQVMVVRHSEPYAKKESGGFKTNASAKTRRDIFLEGKDNTSFLVSLLPSNSNDLRRFLVCPRIVSDHQTASGTSILEPWDVNLSRIEFRVRGYARGEFSTGLNPGHASGTIRVTPNLPEADPWIDQMDSNRLLVDLSYRPINTEKGSSIPVASNVEKVSAGVEAQIEMRGPGGHRRVKTATDQVKLQMGTLHNPINVSVSKSMMQLGSGPCLTIWSEHRIDDQQFNPG